MQFMLKVAFGECSMIRWVNMRLNKDTNVNIRRGIQTHAFYLFSFINILKYSLLMYLYACVEKNNRETPITRSKCVKINPKSSRPTFPEAEQQHQACVGRNLTRRDLEIFLLTTLSGESCQLLLGYSVIIFITSRQGHGKGRQRNQWKGERRRRGARGGEMISGAGQRWWSGKR